jgi:DNA-binding transcriptional LysR family regulator
MPSGVDLREIRTFLIVAEELHFGRAAERLVITPSRVSQTIRTLEARVGGVLFDRTSRRVRLTPFGEHLRAELAPAYEQLNRALTNARQVATGVAGRLRLGMYTPANGGPRLLEILRTFHARYGGCRVDLIDTGFSRDPLDWLRADEVDLLAMRLPLEDKTLIIGPILSRETRVLLVNKDHPLAALPSVRYDDVAEFPVPYTPLLPRELMDAVVPPRTSSGARLRRVPIHSTTEILMRVAAGELIHPTVSSFLHHHPSPDVRAVPIVDLPPSETALVWLAARQSPTIDAFASVAAKVVGSATPVTSKDRRPRSPARR